MGVSLLSPSEQPRSGVQTTDKEAGSKRGLVFTYVCKVSTVECLCLRRVWPNSDMTSQVCVGGRYGTQPYEVTVFGKKKNVFH